MAYVMIHVTGLATRVFVMDIMADVSVIQVHVYGSMFVAVREKIKRVKSLKPTHFLQKNIIKKRNKTTEKKR
jgi:hypothetical protein